MTAETGSQASKAKAFVKLHEQGIFISPNPWDVGSARLLEGLGFPALATTSSGFALTLGRADGEVTRDEKMTHCAALTAATSIPVSADLENGFGDSPQAVVQTIEAAVQAGLAGGSIEDFTGDKSAPLYSSELAVVRIAAAAETIRRLGVSFVLTARAEQMLRAKPDLDATIRRLQAFEKAGADVLYAPGLKRLDEVATVLAEVSLPVNVLMSGLPGASVGQLAELGVRRISTGGSLAYAALRPLLDAGREMIGDGGFNWLSDIASGSDVKKLLG